VLLAAQAQEMCFASHFQSYKRIRRDVSLQRRRDCDEWHERAAIRRVTSRRKALSKQR
jgi:hypothetical protein